MQRRLIVPHMAVELVSAKTERGQGLRTEPASAAVPNKLLIWHSTYRPDRCAVATAASRAAWRASTSVLRPGGDKIPGVFPAAAKGVDRIWRGRIVWDGRRARFD